MQKKHTDKQIISNSKFITEEFNFEEKVRMLVPEFKEKESILRSFKDRIELLLKELINDENINIHNVSSRVKDESSLVKKIEKKGHKYNSINDITDLIGIRIITYFEDDVDKIAKIIEKEFKIDIDNSIDKRKKDYDKFGYQSLHYIISISSDRSNLPEYKKYKHLKAEIQIRSVLQHAWAEMEHDIGYKSKEAIPEQVKRNFSRIAAFLEAADIDFIRIRDQLENYRKELPEKIENEPDNTFIDQDSLIEFIATNKIVKRIDQKIADCEGVDIVKSHFKYLSDMFFLMSKYFNIYTIKDLEDQLISHEKLIINFKKQYLILKPRHVELNSKMINGVSILHLFYVLIASTKDEKKINDFYIYSGINFLPPQEMLNIYIKSI